MWRGGRSFYGSRLRRWSTHYKTPHPGVFGKRGNEEEGRFLRPWDMPAYRDSRLRLWNPSFYTPPPRP